MECQQQCCGARNCHPVGTNRMATDQHVCALCVMKGIDFRHPDTSYIAFDKARDGKYSLSALSAARVMMGIVRLSWLPRNLNERRDSTHAIKNPWNRFTHDYNESNKEETTHILALLYAAIKSMPFQPDMPELDQRPLIVPHSSTLWREILGIRFQDPPKISSPIDVTKVVLEDGSPAIKKLLALAAHYDHRFVNYDPSDPESDDDEPPEDTQPQPQAQVPEEAPSQDGAVEAPTSSGSKVLHFFTTIEAFLVHFPIVFVAVAGLCMLFARADEKPALLN